MSNDALFTVLIEKLQTTLANVQENIDVINELITLFQTQKDVYCIIRELREKFANDPRVKRQLGLQTIIKDLLFNISRSITS